MKRTRVRKLAGLWVVELGILHPVTGVWIPLLRTPYPSWVEACGVAFYVAS